MKFISAKREKDSFRMNLESDLRQDGQITIGHHDEDCITISQDESNHHLEITYCWDIQQDKPVQEGRYRVLLMDRKRRKDDPIYFYPSWQVARWDGESFILSYLYPVEVGYGYDTFTKDVSERVICWEKLPDWMPSEVVQ